LRDGRTSAHVAGLVVAETRQIDHIVAHRAGGPTSFGNGRASCVRSNQVREMPGWAVRLVHDGLGDQPHTRIAVR